MLPRKTVEESRQVPGADLLPKHSVKLHLSRRSGEEEEKKKSKDGWKILAVGKALYS